MPLHSDRVTVVDASPGRYSGKEVAFPLDVGEETMISDIRGDYVLIPQDPDRFWEASRFIAAGSASS